MFVDIMRQMVSGLEDEVGLEQTCQRMKESFLILSQIKFISCQQQLDGRKISCQYLSDRCVVTDTSIVLCCRMQMLPGGRRQILHLRWREM
jgi:hypothetical protein